MFFVFAKADADLEKQIRYRVEIESLAEAIEEGDLVEAGYGLELLGGYGGKHCQIVLHL